MPEAHSNLTPNSRRNKAFSRQPVLVACNACRVRRTACDGRRPSCRKCSERHRECLYDTNSASETRNAAYKRKLEDRDRLLEIIGSFLDRMRLSQDDGLLNVVRNSADNSELLQIMSSLGNGTVHEVPSTPYPPQMTTASLITSSQLEHVLLSSHTKVYSMPLSILADLREHFPGVCSERSERPVLDDSASLYVDNRLRQLYINHWTSIPIPHDMAQTLFSLYLKTDHPILGLFDADFVIDELVELRTQFYSPFLVSSLFFWITAMSPFNELLQ